MVSIIFIPYVVLIYVLLAVLVIGIAVASTVGVQIARPVSEMSEMVYFRSLILDGNSEYGAQA